MTLITILKLLVAVNIVIDAVAFYPQIRSLIKAEKPSKDVSIPAWLIWTYSSAIWTLYAIVMFDDILLIAGAISALLGCAIVLFLAIYNQHFRFKEE